MPGSSTSSIVAREPSDLQGQPDSPGNAQKRKREDGPALASHPPEFAVPLPPMTAAEMPTATSNERCGSTATLTACEGGGGGGEGGRDGGG